MAVERSLIDRILNSKIKLSGLTAACDPSCAFYSLKPRICKIDSLPVVNNANCRHNLSFEAVQDPAVLKNPPKK